MNPHDILLKSLFSVVYRLCWVPILIKLASVGAPLRILSSQVLHEARRGHQRYTGDEPPLQLPNGRMRFCPRLLLVLEMNQAWQRGALIYRAACALSRPVIPAVPTAGGNSQSPPFWCKYPNSYEYIFLCISVVYFCCIFLAAAAPAWRPCCAPQPCAGRPG